MTITKDELEALERRALEVAGIVSLCMDRENAHIVNQLIAEMRSQLRQPSAEVDEARDIISGFLTCPEIADCDARDRDVETSMLESRARAYLARARSAKG